MKLYDSISLKISNFTVIFNLELQKSRDCNTKYWKNMRWFFGR